LHLGVPQKLIAVDPQPVVSGARVQNHASPLFVESFPPVEDVETLQEREDVEPFVRG